MTHPTNPTAIKVKRDGPRGWHWIAAENFDPSIHELADGVPVRSVTATEPASKPKQARKVKP